MLLHKMWTQGNTKQISSLSTTQLKSQPPQPPGHSGGFEVNFFVHLHLLLVIFFSLEK